MPPLALEFPLANRHHCFNHVSRWPPTAVRRFLSHPFPIIGSAHRQEIGLLRNRPDASLRLRARWFAQTRRLPDGSANDRRNPNGLLYQEDDRGNSARACEV